MAGAAGVRQLGPCARVRLPPWADEEPAYSMECREIRTGAARWDGSSSSPRNLTLLAGVTDSTEEDGRGHGHGASSLQNPPRVAGHTCDGDEAATETSKVEARERDRRLKAG
jgi:hypothetical protein